MSLTCHMKHEALLAKIKQLQKEAEQAKRELKKAQKIVQSSEEARKVVEDSREASKERVEAFSKKCKDRLQNEKFPRGKPKGKPKRMQKVFASQPLSKKRKKKKNADSDSDFESRPKKKNKKKKASAESDVVAEPLEDGSVESAVPEATPIRKKGNDDNKENHDNKGNDVEEETPSDPDEEPPPGIKILGHLHDKDKKLWIKCKFDGEKEVVLLEVHSIWADYTADLLAYIDKKKLKGAKWKLPTLEDALEIRQVIDHEADDNGAHTRYLVIWDNGYKEWEDAKNVIEDGKEAVNAYLEELKYAEAEAT